jgi:hypothetical protein
MSSNAVIRAKLVTQYPQFAAVADAVIDAFLEDARLTVPLCRIPAGRQDLALMYKAASLMAEGGLVSAGGGAIKREKSGDVEVEYAVSASATSSVNAFEVLYQNLVRPFTRNSPMVLGWRG